MHLFVPYKKTHAWIYVYATTKDAAHTYIPADIYTYTCTHLYISSSSSCHAGCTDIPDPLSFIALGRSLGQHPVSSHSC